MSAPTWLITPMAKLSRASIASASITVPSSRSSNVPKPSSRKKKPSGWPRRLMCMDSESASDSDTRNVSPPDSVDVARGAPPLSMSRTMKPSSPSSRS